MNPELLKQLRKKGLPTYEEIHQAWASKGRIRSKEIVSGINNWQEVITYFFENYSYFLNKEQKTTENFNVRIKSGERTVELYNDLVTFLKG